MPSQVAQHRPELDVVEVGHRLQDGRRAGGEPSAQRRGRGAQQPLVLLVAHPVDALPQRRPAGALEQRGQRGAVLHLEDLPAGGREHPLPPADRNVRHDPVQGLPVEIDDPQHLPELLHHRVGHALPDGALVELGVAQQRHLPPTGLDRQVGADVAVGDCAPHGRRRPDPDRAGGVVRCVGVLGARRVGLQPAELAQARQPGRVEPPQQGVHGVQDRRGVGLDAHPVRGGQVLEPQRRHQGDHRGARGLVTSHLDPGGVGPPGVRRVHDARGEPQHPPLHLVEDRVVGTTGTGHQNILTDGIFRRWSPPSSRCPRGQLACWWTSPSAWGHRWT